MSDVCSISFALDPTNTPSFLLDWEITKRCNLDCTYCGPTEHDNTTEHPPLAECLQSIDFMFEYVTEYMQRIKPSQRKVILNVYGGESLFHPDIVEILEQVRIKYKPYSDQWYLTVTCTTNGVVGENQFGKIVPLVDYFSMSYHAEGLLKQQKLYFNNLLTLKKSNKPCKAIIMMHNTHWADSQRAIEFCKQHNINYLAKVVDTPKDKEWKYNNTQLDYMKMFWVSKSEFDSNKNMIEQGRACCGGRKLSTNGNLRESITFVPRQGFRDWSCSVNWYFLFVEQLTGQVYTNKDCKTSTTGRIEPLGTISNYRAIIDTVRQQFATGMPVIRCVKDTCACGYCAPKAESPEEFLNLLGRHVVDLGIFDSDKTKSV
jgi:hypothetical protein